ncbi:hypothetical protein M434DRAFT_175588 [Hypoxylon sp. CO27-5]|nr:hypothetical protein M434DRAFT_175588 [Hypoxylon sp. CO27-5]
MENRPFRFSPKACLQQRGRHPQASALRTPLQTGLVLSTLSLALPSSPLFGLLKPSLSLDKGQGFLLVISILVSLVGLSRLHRRLD